jgi:hypothetical protein
VEALIKKVERSVEVAGVVGVDITCLHYIASLDAPYDSLNVMKAVGRLIPKCRLDTYMTVRHGPLEGMSSGKGSVRTQFFHTVCMKWPLGGPSGELAVAAANHDTLGTPRAKSGLAERGASHVTATRGLVIGLIFSYGCLAAPKRGRVDVAE